MIVICMIGKRAGTYRDIIDTRDINCPTYIEIDLIRIFI
jgi:hypothetical protein